MVRNLYIMRKNVRILCLAMTLLLTGTVEAQTYNYDVNGDGQVTLIDAMSVINHLLGQRNPGEEFLSCEDEYHPHLIDLGLPSGTIWYCCNIDGYENFDEPSVEDYGGYYAWGEVEPKSSYTWANYEHSNGTATTVTNIGKNIQETEYDAVNMLFPPAPGGGYFSVTPTAADYQELIDHCTFREATHHGVKGFWATGPNGNSIFFPFSGYSYDGKSYNKGTAAYYWTANLSSESNQKAQAFYIKSGEKPRITTCQRRTGIAVRGIMGDWSDYPTPPEPDLAPCCNLVDLGLSVRWCDQNVYSDFLSPSLSYGNYYAWGETDTKDTYTWTNYLHANGSATTTVYLGNNIQSTEFDAAFQGMMAWDEEGEDLWDVCIPTREQFEELIEECTFKQETVDDIKGYRVTGPNGNHIFLPFSGYSCDGKDYGVGTSAYYWTANASSESMQKAYSLFIKAGEKPIISSCQRRTGVVIRGVERTFETDSLATGDEIPFVCKLVDLGLSVKWADINFSVDSQESSDKDQLFAWGETMLKKTFTWANYEHANGTASSVRNIGNDIKMTEFDAPYNNSVWDYDNDLDDYVTNCMPSKEQFQELINKCTFRETTVDGRKGYRVTGPSGKSIFLPFIGYSCDGKDYGVGTSAYYWTSNASVNDPQKAYALYIKTGASPTITVCQRRTGIAIRPVCTKTK